MKNLEDWLYPKKGLKQDKKEMIENLFRILNENITESFSHRMQSHYIARVLSASNIDTASIDKIESRLQAEYRKHKLFTR